jgi:hypothetical protein
MEKENKMPIRFNRRRLHGTFGAGSGKGAVQFVNGFPNVANLADIANFNVINWNDWEITNQSLYDSASYVAAGQSSLAFFQTPIGQGTGFGGGAKTLSDTNMNLAGQLPNGQMFIVTSLEIGFQPTTPSVTADLPAAIHAANAVPNIINDSYIFWRSGNLVFNVLSKNYVIDAPLMKFPPSADLAGFAAAAAGTGIADQIGVQYANSSGPTYLLTPNNILVTSNQNFKVTLAWPEGVQAITNPGRVFVTLNGMNMRLTQ